MKHYLPFMLIACFIVAAFSSANGQEATLLSPYGGEYLVQETQHAISWESASPGTLTIEFSSNGGTDWSTVQSGVAASEGSFQWEVPQVESTTCLLRLTHSETPDEPALSSPFAIGTAAGLPRVLIDENFRDWEPLAPLTEGNGGIASLKAFNDDQFLFIYFRRQQEFSLQNDDNTVLYIDADNDPTTGKIVQGIGAEIEFSFGKRSGKIHTPSGTESIGASNLFLVSSPTVRSNRFELSIARDAAIYGNKIFTGNQIRLLLQDKSGDAYAPAASGGAGYAFTDYDLPPLPSYRMKKAKSNHLRMLSHNVEFDGFFEVPHKEPFARIFQAVEPDIIGLQEIYDHSNAQVASRVEEILPSAEGNGWNAAHIHDNFIVTRYSIIQAYAPGNFGNGAFLIDLRPDYDANMLVFVAHPPCCDNDADRQKEVDAMAAFLRDAKTAGGEIDIAPNTPVVYLGDMNFVGDPAQVSTLMDGDIQDESTYGQDFAPDWDDTSFEDAKPYNTHLPMTFTQGNSEGPGRYSKGRLDYIMYSGSVMELHNSYVLYSHSMPQDTLNAYNLEASDTETASDHFPLVTDFTITADPVEDQSILPLRQNNSQGIPTFLDQIRTITGTVTVAGEFGNTGPAFMQDDEAGIALYGEEFTSAINRGDEVTLTAKVGFFRGLTEMVHNAAAFSLSANPGTEVNPKVTAIGEIINQDWNNRELLEGKLVTLESISTTGTGNFEANANYTITDGTQEMILRIDADTDIPGEAIPGDAFHLTGIVSQYDQEAPYNAGYQILPRSMADINTATWAEAANSATNLAVTPYPNPASGTVDVQFLMPGQSNARLCLYNVSGQKIREIINENLTAGKHRVQLNSEIKAGVYFLRLQTAKGTATSKLLIR